MGLVTGYFTVGVIFSLCMGYYFVKQGDGSWSDSDEPTMTFAAIFVWPIFVVFGAISGLIWFSKECMPTILLGIGDGIAKIFTRSEQTSKEEQPRKFEDI